MNADMDDELIGDDDKEEMGGDVNGNEEDYSSEYCDE